MWHDYSGASARDSIPAGAFTDRCPVGPRRWKLSAVAACRVLDPGVCLATERLLPEAGKRLQVDAELIQDAIEQRRSNFVSAVYRDCCRASVRMLPPFVAAGLPSLVKT